MGPAASGLYAGYYTLLRKDTGTHATYEVRVAKKGSLAGKTILCKGTGYLESVPFAFINEDGSVVVWNKMKKDSSFEKHGKAFKACAIDGLLAGVVEVKLEKRCVRCSRTLTHPESIDSGIGPECAKK